MKFSFRNRLSIIVSFAVSAGLVTRLITWMDFTRAIDSPESSRATLTPGVRTQGAPLNKRLKDVVVPRVA
jgi:hypothetical protein